MLIPPIPNNEAERLNALLDTGLLDSLPEERFDRLTRLAQKTFNVKYALVSLVDSDRQWFKSRQGLDACQTGRDISFCGHAILGESIFEVPNACEDTRFADNPLVIGPPHIRFYAGAPVHAEDGQSIGTLCLIDDQPRWLTEKEKHILRDLADCVSEEISSHVEKSLREERELFSSGPVFTIVRSPTTGWPVKYVSANVADILGYTPSEVCGDEFLFSQIIYPEDAPRVTQQVADCCARDVNACEQSYRLRLKSGEYRWFYDFSRIMRNARGEVETIRGYLYDQTQQRESETELARERSRLADIIEGTRVGTWEWNVQTGETVFNKRWAEIVGYTLEELEPTTIETWMNLAHPDDLEQSSAALEKCFTRESDYYDIEARMRHKDGHWVWVHDRGKVVAWTEDGSPLLMSGTHAEITEKKRAEEAVAQYADFQKVIFENIPAIMFVKDENFRIIECNSQFLSVYPESMRDKVIGRTTVEEYDEREAEEFLREDRKAFAEGYSETEESILFPTGERRTLWTKKIRFKNSDGVPFILGVSTDITERIQQEAQKEELRTRLSLATNAAGVGIWVYDVVNNQLDWDDHMFRLYGVNARSFSGAYDAWSNGLHPDDKALSEQALQDALEGKREFDIVFRVVWPNGEVRHIQAAAHIERDADGKPLRMIGTNWDITEEKQTQASLKRAKLQAEVATRAKSDFLANMSHEIRTPINGVLGMINLALKNTREKDQVRRLQLASQSATSLLTIINDILDFSKIEAGHLDVESIEFNLPNLLSELVESHAPTAHTKGLRVLLDAVAVNHQWVKGDPHRIKQIVNNLLSNAIKFTDHGEIFVRAELVAEQSRWRLNCSVQDSGMGIKASKIAQLFDPFTQADSSTTRNFGGTGLGLSIVKKLCELMGGSIAATSEIGKGSCFSFNIQLDQAEARDNVLLPKADKNLNILVLEPCQYERDIIVRQLNAWQQHVEVASNWQQARAFHDGFDVAFVAESLFSAAPSSIGAQLHQINNSQIPALNNSHIVVMANSLESSGQLNLQSLGAGDCFPKPATPSDLLDALVTCCSDLNQNQSTARSASSEHTVYSGGRVLLVEDNLINQEVASALLEEHGLEVITAENGLEAIKVLQQNTGKTSKHIDLVFMDCQMPEMDGYQATRAIREGQAGDQYQQITIIALTANAMKGDAEKCINAGMNSHLAKPIEEAELIKQLQTYLGDKKTNQETSLPQGQAASNLTVWNQEILKVRVKGKEERIQKFIGLFVAEQEQRFEKLKQLQKEPDMEQIRQFAHYLKGSATSLACEQLADITTQTEQAALQNNQKIIPDLLQQLELAIEQVHDEFNRYLKLQAQKNSPDVGAL